MFDNKSLWRLMGQGLVGILKLIFHHIFYKRKARKGPDSYRERKARKGKILTLSPLRPLRKPFAPLKESLPHPRGGKFKLAANPNHSFALPESGVAPRLGQGLGHDRFVQRAGVGEPCRCSTTTRMPMPDDDGGGERLDLAAVGLHLGGGAAGHVRLDLLTEQGLGGYPLSQIDQLWAPVGKPPCARLRHHGVTRASCSAWRLRSVPNLHTGDGDLVDHEAHAGGAHRQPVEVVADRPTSCSMRCSVEAMVNSRTGSASWPLRMRRPEAPVEKSPLTGLTPECSSWTDLDQHAVVDVGRSARLATRARAAVAGARQPTPGVPLNPPAHGIAGGRGAGPAGRVRRVHELLQHAGRRSATLRRAASPSPSSSVAVYASGLVGSSTRVTIGDATSSPRRSVNSERPLATASPLSVLEMIPRNFAVT